VAIFIFIINIDSIFYELARDSFKDIPRFYGCLASSFFGFSLLVFNRIKTKEHDLDFPFLYFYYYPIICILGSSLSFGVFSIFEITKNHIFYFLAFPTSFICAYLSENFYNIIISKLTK